LISDTQIGTGIISIDSNNSDVVGIGTTFLNNIYYVHSISYSGSNAVITSNIDSSTSVVGLNSSGSVQTPLGKFSWGRLHGFSTRISPISISLDGYTINSGLSTFPVIQRRNYGLRDTGSLRYNFD
jgi:hypothetical protein